MIYVAAPYTHSDTSVIAQRMLVVNNYCVKLLKAKKGAFLSPLTVGHALVEHDSSLPKTSEFWLEWCEHLIEGASELHVLKIEGWEQSEGVRKEIEWAQQLEVNVVYVEV